MPTALGIDFKDPSIVFTDALCFNFTVARPNKNNNNNKKKKKKMEKFGYFTVPKIIKTTVYGSSNCPNN